MKFKIFILLFIVISILPFLQSDNQLPDQCGGDNELVISCLGDQELIFLGGLTPTSIGGLYTGIGPESTTSPPSKEVAVPVPEKAKPLVLPVLVVVFLAAFLILIYKKKGKKQEEKKKKEEETKNLNSSVT